MSSTDSPEPEAVEARELRAAQRTLVLFGVAVAAVLVGVLFLAFGSRDGDPSTIGTGGDVDDGIGPRPGDEVGSYVSRRSEALREVEGERVAVVSFSRYLGVEDVDRLVGDALIIAYLVALPGDGPRVTDSPEDARRSAIDEAESQLAEIGPLVPTVDDEDFAEFYRAELIRYRKVVDAAGRDDIVFGAVVRGRSAALRGVASRPGVRLVDVADGAAISDRAELAGLRPEEAVSAGSPRFRP